MAAEEVIPRQSGQSGTRLRAGAIGLGILGVLWYRKKDDWIAKAGAATVDADVIEETDPA